ncbi:MAG: 16S rRNA (guanine(527)-N(7))-methyltransferase RsmG, partial [Rickettsiales bacterium]
MEREPLQAIDYNAEIEQNVSRETFQQLQKFKELILKWNKAQNLTSRSSVSMGHLDELIADSLILDQLIPKNCAVLDIGSGGGFPGLVLAILGHRIDLVERNFKKTVFLTEAKRQLDLPLCKVLNTDIRDLDQVNKYQYICSKAMATSEFIVNATAKNIVRDSKYLLLKSPDQMSEIEQLKKLYRFTLQQVENKYKTN